MRHKRVLGRWAGSEIIRRADVLALLGNDTPTT